MALARLVEGHPHSHIQYSEPIDHLTDPKVPHETVLEYQNGVEIGGFWRIPGIPNSKGLGPTLIRRLPQTAEKITAIEPAVKPDYTNHPGCLRGKQSH
jgi:hypothetical protein